MHLDWQLKVDWFENIHQNIYSSPWIHKMLTKLVFFHMHFTIWHFKFYVYHLPFHFWHLNFQAGSTAVDSLNCLNWHRKYILCCTFLMIEAMFEVHLRFREIVDPRNLAAPEDQLFELPSVQTGLLRYSCWCKVEEQGGEHTSLGGSSTDAVQCWMWIFPSSPAASCLSGSLWSTGRSRLTSELNYICVEDVWNGLVFNAELKSTDRILHMSLCYG